MPNLMCNYQPIRSSCCANWFNSCFNNRTHNGFRNFKNSKVRPLLVHSIKMLSPSIVTVEMKLQKRTQNSLGVSNFLMSTTNTNNVLQITTNRHKNLHAHLLIVIQDEVFMLIYAYYFMRYSFEFLCAPSKE